MGYDGSYNTIGYCQRDDIPIFKVYSNSNDELFEISSNHIQGYTPNSIMRVEEVYANSTQNSIPETFNIVSVYPNPFNPVATIKFSTPYNKNLSITIYNVHGELVESLLAEKSYNAGYHEVVWDASNYSSGIYFVKMESQKLTRTQKAILVK